MYIIIQWFIAVEPTTHLWSVGPHPAWRSFPKSVPFPIRADDQLIIVIYYFHWAWLLPIWQMLIDLQSTTGGNWPPIPNTCLQCWTGAEKLRCDRVKTAIRRWRTGGLIWWGSLTGGFLVDLSLSRLMTSSDGFLGKRVEVLPGPSSVLSVVMFSSSTLDDASGFPFRLPFGPTLGGLESGMTFPPPWSLGSRRSTSSSTTNTLPGMRPLERLAPEGTVPSPRRLARRANTFCSELQGTLGSHPGRASKYLSDLYQYIFLWGGCCT